MDSWVVGIDLGGTKIALGLIDQDNQVVARCRIPTDAHEGLLSVVERIAGCVAELQAAVPAGSCVSALGICSPGPVDHQAGRLLDPPNLPGLHHTPLRDALSDRLGLPVALEHDAKAAALGEYHYGAGRGERSMVFIVLGTGVGGAIIADGQLYRGTSNSAGEIGHVTLDRAGDLCSCGCRGCVETYVSGPGLARRYARAAQAAGKESPGPVTGERVARLARQGDPLALQVMTQGGEALGVAVASMAMILDIELYVIGSSVARAGDLLLDPARRTVPDCSYRSVSSRVHIAMTELWDDGPILGCGWLARQRARASTGRVV
jgi:glucokinase